MIAPARKDYLLMRDAARAVGISYGMLRRQVKAGRIPKEFLLLSGDVRPVVRIHRSWVERLSAPPAAVTCEIVIPWGAK